MVLIVAAARSGTEDAVQGPDGGRQDQALRPQNLSEPCLVFAQLAASPKRAPRKSQRAFRVSWAGPRRRQNCGSPRGPCHCRRHACTLCTHTCRHRVPQVQGPAHSEESPGGAIDRGQGGPQAHGCRPGDWARNRQLDHEAAGKGQEGGGHRAGPSNGGLGGCYWRMGAWAWSWEVFSVIYL